MSQVVKQMLLLVAIVSISSALIAWALFSYQLGGLSDKLNEVKVAFEKSGQDLEEISTAALHISSQLDEVRRESNALSANFIRFYAHNDPYRVSLGGVSKLFKEESEALQFYGQSPRTSILTNRYFAGEFSESGWSLEFTERHDGRLKAEMFSFQGEARVFPSLSAFEARLGSLEYLLARSVPK